MKHVSDKSKKALYVQELLSESGAFCEMMSENEVQPDRPQMSIQYRASALHAV